MLEHRAQAAVVSTFTSTVEDGVMELAAIVFRAERANLSIASSPETVPDGTVSRTSTSFSRPRLTLAFGFRTASSSPSGRLAISLRSFSRFSPNDRSEAGSAIRAATAPAMYARRGGMFMTRRLAILGTCASEDWVRYQNQRSALDVKLVPKRFHSSIISLCAKPISPPHDLGDISEADKLMIRRDFGKLFLRELIETQPDCLLVDLASDGLDGVIAYDGSWLTPTQHLPWFATVETGRRKHLAHSRRTPRRYLSLFRASLVALKNFLDLHLPACRFMLHKARFADSYRNAQDEIVPFSEDKLKLNRTANWNAAVLEDMFAQHFRCDVISLLDQPLLAE